MALFDPYQINTTLPPNNMQTQPQQQGVLGRFSNWLDNPSNQAFLLNAGKAVAGPESMGARITDQFLPGAQGQIQEKYQAGKEADQKKMTFSNILNTDPTQLLASKDITGVSIKPDGSVSVKAAGPGDYAKEQATLAAVQAQQGAAQVPQPQQSQLNQTSITPVPQQQPVQPTQPSFSQALGGQFVNPTNNPPEASGRGLSPEQLLAAQQQSRANVGQPYNNALNAAQQAYQNVLGRRGEQELVLNQPIPFETLGMQGTATMGDIMKWNLEDEDIKARRAYNQAMAGIRADAITQRSAEAARKAQMEEIAADDLDKYLEELGAPPEARNAARYNKGAAGQILSHHQQKKDLKNEQTRLRQSIKVLQDENEILVKQYASPGGLVTDPVTKLTTWETKADALRNMQAKAATDPKVKDDLDRYYKNKALYQQFSDKLMTFSEVVGGTEKPQPGGQGQPQPQPGGPGGLAPPPPGGLPLGARKMKDIDPTFDKVGLKGGDIWVAPGPNGELQYFEETK